MNKNEEKFNSDELNILALMDKISKEKGFKEEFYRGNIGPDFIKYLLSNMNKDNRALYKNYVDFYLGLMEKGQWHSDAPIPIVIGKKGIIVDGQHRLNAALLFNQIMSFLFIFTSRYDSPLNTPFDLGKGRQNFEVTGNAKELTQITDGIGKVFYGGKIDPYQSDKLFQIFKEAAKRCFDATDQRMPVPIKSAVTINYMKNDGDESIIEKYQSYIIGGENTDKRLKDTKRKIKKGHFTNNQQFLMYYILFDPTSEFDIADYTTTITTSSGSETKIDYRNLKKDILDSLKDWFDEVTYT